MSHLHKEKERLRHQKQVKLLNEVMKYIPRVPNEPQSKVRNLRNLVLYVHYMQIIHSNLTQRLCSNDIAVENSVKSSVTKRASKPIKVFHQPKKRQRAHIVFLHADKTGNCSNNVPIQKVQDNDQESSPVVPSSYEYKVPDVVSGDSRTDMLVNQEDTFMSEEIDCLQDFKDFSVPLNNCDVLSKSDFCNNEKAFENLDSNLSKNHYHKDKENFLPIAANSESFNYNAKESEEYSLYDVDKFAHNIVVNDENLRASNHKMDNFRTHMTNRFDNNDLENFEFSSAINKNFKNLDPSSCDEGKEYLLNSYESNNIQNFNPGYESSSFTTKHFQNSNSDYSDYNFDFSLNSDSKQPIYYDESSAIEKTSNYSTSSTSTTKINIDMENLSDSSRSCNNLSDSSNSTQYNSCNSCINASYNPLSNFTKLEEALEMESDAFPLFLHPNFSYIENSSLLMNESLIGQMYDTTMPHFSGVYPSRINFNSNSNSSAFQPDSVHLFKNEVQETDFEYLYSPSLYNNSNSEQLSMLPPKQTVTCFNNSPGTFITENSQPVLYEEVSYPLADYLSNY